MRKRTHPPGRGSGQHAARRRRGGERSGTDAGHFPIIGLGASAGGLDALAHFLKHVPARSGAAFVVVQHLDPTHDSLLVELLQRSSAMPVSEITDGVVVAPDHVYVIPPDRELTLGQGMLHLLEPKEPRGHRLAIDAFFTSLADNRQQHAVGVVLSGAGADGTLGLMAIKENGGLTAVQEPASAGVDSMPRSAIDAGLADLVAPADQLPARILSALRTSARSPYLDLAAVDRGGTWLARIQQVLQSQTGHDFSLYKKTTLYRRIERRMGLRRIATLAEYADYLQQHPLEGTLLLKELLIGVTRFFRDPEVWDQLRAEVIPALIARLPEGGPLRAWSAGCATGEEAYSLAMLFREVVEQVRPKAACTLQIFATDLNQTAIDRARRGLYPANVASAFTPERLRRFFVEDPRGYRVCQEIREMVIFAPHNLLADPPFTKLDILICRNLMIYLAPDVHETLLPRFHFSLNPGGVLMLGSSESVGAATNLFSPLAGYGQLYQRLDAPLHPQQLGVSLGTPSSIPLAPLHRSVLPMTAKVIGNVQALVDQLLLQRYAPAAVLVTATGDILHVSGKTGRYLEPATGKANWNVLAMAREGLSSTMSEAFYDALRQQATVTLTAAQSGEDGVLRCVDITVQPLLEPAALRGMVVIVFADVAAPATPPALDQDDRTARQSARLKTMEQALQATREELQTTREEMQTSREELTSTNEELQSTNEELTTSAEELRSMNEELVRARSAAELGLARYTDLFDSAPVGYFTLDRNGVISQANLAGSALLGLGRDRPAGARLALFVMEADRPAFASCIERAFASGEGQTCEVALWREVPPLRRVRISALAVDDGRICRVVVVDVSEIRQAEAALRESEERFRTLADHAPVLIWIAGPDKLCTHFNKIWLEFTGRTMEQEIGDGWAEGVHPDDLARCLETYEAAFEARRKFSMEYRLRRHDGEYRWMFDAGLPRFAANGTFLGYSGSCIDITERMRAEAAVKISEERYRMLWETTTDAVIVLDEQSRIQYANRALKDIFGYEPEAIIGQSIGLLQPQRLREAHRAGVARYLSTGSKRLNWRGTQTVGLHQDGREIPIEISFSHVSIDGRHLFAGFLRDLTDRMHAEKALRESEERYRRIVETANEGIWLIDAEARTSFVNPKMAEMIGYTPEEMHERPLTDFMDAEGRAQAESNLKRRQQGIAEKHDFRFRHKSGADVWTLVSTNPIHDSGGAYAGVMAMVTDITERKRLESELRHAHKMEAVGRLAGGIAHDFNNQLTVIQGYGALALTRTSDETLNKCLSHIVNASERSADLVRQLLSFSRKSHHTVTPVDVHSIISDVQDVLSRSLNKLIRVHQAFAASDAMIRGDAGLLQNAFLNLSLNARDAMPAGGDLRFATALVELDAARAARMGAGVKPGPYLEITVSDTGQGMSDEVQKHLFEPFFSTKAPGQGTGLGLASVYGTITQHGGGIEVDSVAGRGTTFRVYLPRSAPLPVAQQGEPSRLPAPTAASGINLLVVDDEEFVAGLVADTLAGLGYGVVCKQDGATALEHYRAHWRSIDLIVLDMNMPVMSGPETFAAMRTVNPQAKVLVMSGYSEEGGIDALMRKGALGFVPKPFKPESLAHQVAQALLAKPSSSP